MLTNEPYYILSANLIGLAFIVVTTRGPFSYERSAGKETVRYNPGGVSTSLSHLMQKEGGTWICWGDGNNDKQHPDEISGNYRIIRVFINDRERRGFYDDYSNSTLWPLFHYFRERIKYPKSAFLMYRKVNHDFLEAVKKVYSPGDTIWIHDYQLTLLPAMIRSEIPDARIVFTWHIPWVSGEFFSSLPESEEIIKSLCTSNCITFHTELYVRNFLDSVSQITGESESVRGKVHSIPLGIDYSYYHRKSEALQRSPFHGDQKAIFSVDRMDYTKGLTSRVNAIETLLEEHPDLSGKFVYYMAVSPSRTHVREYRTFKSDLEMHIGRINGRFSTFSWVPIMYMNKKLPESSLIGFYRFSHVALITPLFDGLNLVSKEFVASSRDGVLIISKFAGSASQLTGAIKVNPNSRAEMAQAIYTALNMEPEERRTRLEQMKKDVSRHNSTWWIRRIKEVSRRG